MGTTTYYTFFDRAVMDPVWRMPWKEFFRRYPRGRSKVGEVVKFCFNSDDKEPSDTELADIFEQRTLAWTIRRSTGQFFLMSEMMALVPDLRRHSTDISTGYTEDFFALVAAALDGRVRGCVSEPTLRAILKLHNFQEPGIWLNLPNKLVTQAKRLVPFEVLSKPMYAWQGLEACQYFPFGCTDYECDNCLGLADTRRLLDFIELAWERTWDVPYLKSETGGGMSVDLEAVRSVNLQDVDLAHRLMKKLRTVRRFGKPGVFRFLT